jgi:superfamily I DNA/RNA helicase
MLCDGATTIDQVKKNIDNLFQDGDVKKIILASSIHKYKGKENDVVFVLHDTLRSHNEEELNIAYISFSRAKTHLYLVKKEPNKPQ